MKKKVIVGLSGGVDSSVAALLLKQEGYDVTGLFMINWKDTTGTLAGDCPWKDDLLFAEMVARRLEIPFLTVDFSDRYRERVVDYMFTEYSAGRTPNPDVLCNREIKFDLFLQKALEEGADYIATGHYCRREPLAENPQIVRLLAGIDKNKDQSYFLCQLHQEQLARSLFPLGNLTKPMVREMARTHKLPTAERKDSQGICFIGKVDLPAFLQQKLEPREGNIIEIPANAPVYSENENQEDPEVLVAPYRYAPEMGKIAGKHRGAWFYTIGQNKGLNIGGRPKPSFVIATDPVNNIIYTGVGDDHPGLYRKGLRIAPRDIHWVRPDLMPEQPCTRDYLVRIRYRQPLQEARIVFRSSGAYILFREKQRGITPGQFAAWYDGEEVIGSGAIAE
ncbi:MAG: tRNA 2-thiouridine(34) synthase MnmA [Bacteroidales bacterium]|jgi:tRNA-specific 2-thiouridylase|nr:tRNA 2-thiouridine(34) synthase MnmA [Bacteroidales bacterium]